MANVAFNYFFNNFKLFKFSKKPGIRITMGIDHPLPLGRVGMARTNVLGLEMLHLGEDIVPIAHFY